MFSPVVLALLACSYAPAPLPRPSPASYLGIDAKASGAGVVVDVVYISSPAEQAGLTTQDVILSIDGRSVHSLNELNAVLRKTKPGHSVPIVVRRGDEEVRVDAKLLPRRNFPYLGLSLSTTAVEEMPADSPCRAAGMQSGDVIVSIDGKPIATRQEVVAAIVEKRVGESVDVVVTREGERKTIRVKLGSRPGY
jgi:S1-C subfamily serine protease